MSILEVKNITVKYRTETQPINAVDDVSFEVKTGDKIGIVGESGSGKSTLLKSILRLLPEEKAQLEGSVIFEGRNLFGLEEKAMVSIRGREISMIPQNSAVSLDPVYTIGKQLIETIRMHRKVGAEDSKKLAQQLLEMVGFGSNVMGAYPHEMSGGMRQRAVIAMSISSNPILLLADEITSGLDVIVQDQILDLLDHLQNELAMTTLLVTHDISIVAERCSKVIVMYGGRIMEAGKAKDVLNHPSHPYTMMLLRCLPDLEGGKDLVSLPDPLPSVSSSLQGCRFRSRCPFAKKLCAKEEPKLRSVTGNGQQVACHFVERAEEFRLSVQSSTLLAAGEEGSD